MNRVCEDCGEAIINAGAHYESCVGEVCRDCGYVVTSGFHRHQCLQGVRERDSRQAHYQPEPTPHGGQDVGTTGAARGEVCDCPPGWQHKPDCPEVTG